MGAGSNKSIKTVNSISLFEEYASSVGDNLLPYDGIVHYHGKIFTPSISNEHQQLLFNEIDWEHDEVMMFGKKIITKRKVAWYGDQPFDYTYSHVKKTALPWTATLQAIKDTIEEVSGETYNSCLLNLYHNGQEGMGWHTDAEKELKKDGAIASVSFGANRKFCFKHKTTQLKIDVELENGSLLVMKGTTQTHWLHRLPPTNKVQSPRINLTFRTIIG
jgi:alkylated DNA repair dioxygenase AlkB